MHSTAAGHTHGGQLWPFHYLTALANPYIAGLHEHVPASSSVDSAPASTFIYVSRGMRLPSFSFATLVFSTNFPLIVAHDEWFLLLLCSS